MSQQKHWDTEIYCGLNTDVWETVIYFVGEKQNIMRLNQKCVATLVFADGTSLIIDYQPEYEQWIIEVVTQGAGTQIERDRILVGFQVIEGKATTRVVGIDDPNKSTKIQSTSGVLSDRIRLVRPDQKLSQKFLVLSLIHI